MRYKSSAEGGGGERTKTFPEIVRGRGGEGKKRREEAANRCGEGAGYNSEVKRE